MSWYVPELKAEPVRSGCYRKGVKELNTSGVANIVANAYGKTKALAEDRAKLIAALPELLLFYAQFEKGIEVNGKPCITAGMVKEALALRGLNLLV